MYHRDLKITGLSPAHANAFWRLLTFTGREKARPGVCVALLRDGVPLVITNGQRKLRLPDSFKTLTAENLEAAARQLHVKLMVAVEEASLAAIVEEVQAGYRHDGDTFDLIESGLLALKQAAAGSGLLIYPDFLTFIFDLDGQKLRRGFDAVFPPESSWVLYLFSGQRVEAGLIAVRGKESIEIIAGHEAIERLAAGFHPWQKGYGKILEAVKKSYAPPSLGIFADVDKVREALWYPGQAHFVTGFASGKIIIDPIPFWIAAALGVDAMTRVASTSIDILRRFDALGIARRFDIGGLGRTLQQRLSVEQLSLQAIFGFDPLTLIAKILAWLAP